MSTRTVQSSGGNAAYVLVVPLVALLLAGCAAPRAVSAPAPVAQAATPAAPAPVAQVAPPATATQAAPPAAAAPAGPAQCWDVQDTVGVYGVCRQQGIDHPHCVCFTMVLQNVSPDPQTRATPEERTAANMACGTHVVLDASDVTAETAAADPAGGFI